MNQIENFEGGIVSVPPYGDPVIPRVARDRPMGVPKRMRFGRISGFDHTPASQLKIPHEGVFLIGGEGGIRTHVPGIPDHLISSQRRYGHFGTSPESCVILPAMLFNANPCSCVVAA